MYMWIGLDDTDSRTGGCTTFVAFQLVHRLISTGFSVIGYPRLVRLNPNIPWKTRGNGAVAIQVSKGSKSDIQIGLNKDTKLMGGKTLDHMTGDVDTVREIVCSLIEEYASFDDDNTNPGIVISNKLLPPYLYQNAIQKIVTIRDVVEELDGLDVWYKGYKNQRGLIGASAALSWNDTMDKTFEIIYYRRKNRWGTKRMIDTRSVLTMDERCPSTFDNYDRENHHLSIAPNSPCPVLFGIRGDHQEPLPACGSMIEAEPSQGWMIFVTNQATDDHLQRKKIESIEPYQSVITRGTVSKNPFTIPGGHVLFTLEDEKGKTIDCAAYEPTKQFRNAIRQLEKGDIVEVYGGVRKKPLTINIEKIAVHYLIDVVEKIENPLCPLCGKHMRSKGKGKGYHCKGCGTKEAKPIVRKKDRLLSLGFYEVPVCARRHLSKPLKRMDDS